MHLQNEHGWVIVENQQQQQGRVPFGFLTQDSSEIRKNDDAVTSSLFLCCMCAVYLRRYKYIFRYGYS